LKWGSRPTRSLGEPSIEESQEEGRKRKEEVGLGRLRVVDITQRKKRHRGHKDETTSWKSLASASYPKALQSERRRHSESKEGTGKGFVGVCQKGTEVPGRKGRLKKTLDAKICGISTKKLKARFPTVGVEREVENDGTA